MDEVVQVLGEIRDILAEMRDMMRTQAEAIKGVQARGSGVEKTLENLLQSLTPNLAKIFPSKSQSGA